MRVEAKLKLLGKLLEVEMIGILVPLITLLP